MAGNIGAESRYALNQQIQDLRAQYPDLFEYLVARETQLNRLLNAAPSPGDVERAAVFDAGRHLRLMKQRLAPIIPALLDRPATPTSVTRKHLRLLEFEPPDGEVSATMRKEPYGGSKRGEGKR